MPTGIEYLDETWNIVLGCQHESQGCVNCWAERVSVAHANHPNPKISEAYAGVTKDGKWTGEVKCLEDRLDIPRDWKKPRIIGVSFMGDLFHKAVHPAFIYHAYAIMAMCKQHTFIVPTKHIERAATLMASSKDVDHVHIKCYMDDGMESEIEWPLPNVWLMASISNQNDANKMLPALMETPAAKRLVSLEPALGMVNFSVPWMGAKINVLEGALPAISPIDVIILGGESGPKARPMHLDWARSVRDQCKAAGVPFFFKQWGEYIPVGYYSVRGTTHPEQQDFLTHDDRIVTLPDSKIIGQPYNRYGRVGKKAAGCLLDGVEYKEWPT